MKILSLPLLIILMFFLTGCEKKPNQDILDRDLVIDTDVGIDDAMALAYLFQYPDIKVRAIAISVTGNTSCREGYNNIKALINQFTTQDIPVACGQETPLMGDNQFPQRIIDLMNKYAAVGLPKLDEEPRRDAVMMLYKAIQSADKPVNLLAIGPHTNIALLLLEHPDIKDRIHHIYAMGGAYNVEGNVHHIIHDSLVKESEWNIYIDPVAANIVFKSEIPITLVPLDITRYAQINEDVYDMVKHNGDAPANQFVLSILDSNDRFLKSKTWQFWDPMTAVLMLHPDLANCPVSKIGVLFDYHGAHDGKLFIDTQYGGMVNVCLDLHDTQAFYQTFLDGLSPSRIQKKPL